MVKWFPSPFASSGTASDVGDGFMRRVDGDRKLFAVVRTMPRDALGAACMAGLVCVMPSVPGDHTQTKDMR